MISYFFQRIVKRLRKKDIILIKIINDKKVKKNVTYQKCDILKSYCTIPP